MNDLFRMLSYGDEEGGGDDVARLADGHERRLDLYGRDAGHQGEKSEQSDAAGHVSCDEQSATQETTGD